MAWRCLEVTCPGDELVNGKALDRFVRLRVDRAERLPSIARHSSACIGASEIAHQVQSLRPGKSPPSVLIDTHRHHVSIWRGEYLQRSGEYVALMRFDPTPTLLRPTPFRRRLGRARCPHHGRANHREREGKYLAARNRHINLLARDSHRNRLSIRTGLVRGNPLLGGLGFQEQNVDVVRGSVVLDVQFELRRADLPDAVAAE